MSLEHKEALWATVVRVDVAILPRNEVCRPSAGALSLVLGIFQAVVLFVRTHVSASGRLVGMRSAQKLIVDPPNKWLETRSLCCDDPREEQATYPGTQSFRAIDILTDSIVKNTQDQCKSQQIR
jgi:hypothetical protein